MPAVMNAANEVAVEAFLKETIGFTDIVKVTEETVSHHRKKESPSLEDILEADQWARNIAQKAVERMSAIL